MATIARHLLALGAVILAAAAPAAAQEPTKPTATAAESQPRSAFTQQIDVDVVSLNVSVVNGRGEPVTDLTADDFRIFVDGEPVPVTNFSDVSGSHGADPSAPSDLTHSAEGGSASGRVADSQRVSESEAYLAIVFDNSSLEKGVRKRVVASLRVFLEEELDEETQVMVATTSPSFEIVQRFATDRRRLLAALDRVIDSDTSGSTIRDSKRMFIASIRRANDIGTNWKPLSAPGWRTSGSSNNSQAETRGAFTRFRAEDTDSALGGVHGNEYVAQVEAVRQQESQRILNALLGVEMALRAIGGMSGRKDVLWIGEDLLMSPGLDVYQVLYSKFEDYADQLDLEIPTMWASEHNLVRQFETLAGIGQVTGTTLHVVDASNRDRDLASADNGVSNPKLVTAAFGSGPGLTPGYDMPTADAMGEGGQFLAAATGGSFYVGSRDLPRKLGQLGELLTSWYSLGYVADGELDGKLQPVQVQVTGDRDLRVRHHHKVARVSPYQRLTTRAYSQLVLGETFDPFHVEAEAVGSEPFEDTDKIVQTVRLVVPVDGLVMAPRESDRVGTLSVAVVAVEASGAASGPKVFRLPVVVPADRVAPGARAASSFRLVLEPGTQALAVAMRDEASGKVGSFTVPLL